MVLPEKKLQGGVYGMPIFMKYMLYASISMEIKYYITYFKTVKVIILE